MNCAVCDKINYLVDWMNEIIEKFGNWTVSLPNGDYKQNKIALAMEIKWLVQVISKSLSTPPCNSIQYF